MNSKDGFADGTSTYAMSRLLYFKKSYEPILKKTWGASDSSTTTQKRKMVAVGKTSESSNFVILSHTGGYPVKEALRRVRAGGATVPKKFNIK